MKTLLIDKVQCGKALGGISGKQVLHLVRTKGLPCVYLSRRTLRFNLDKVLAWRDTLPKLRKTPKQLADAKRRKNQA